MNGLSYLYCQFFGNSRGEKFIPSGAEGNPVIRSKSPIV